jgi:predicted RNase H-like nuclease (RuvC/YqgF family)
MSHESEFISYDDDEELSSVTPKPDEKIAESVESLRVWVSSIEDNVVQCVHEVRSLNDAVEQNERTLETILRGLKHLTAQVKTKDRMKRMTECNRELGFALSAKLYRSEAKRLKTTYTPVNTFHPSVIPFIFSDTEDEEEQKEDEKTKQ